jgi:hypothetical protein
LTVSKCQWWAVLYAVLFKTFFKTLNFFNNFFKSSHYMFQPIRPSPGVILLVLGKLPCSFILPWSYPCRPMYMPVYSFPLEFDHYQALADWTSRQLGPGANGSAVCTSICLTSLTLCTFNNWEKQFFHLFRIFCEFASRSPFSSFIKLFLG